VAAPPKKGRALLWVGIAIAVVAVLAIAVFAFGSMGKRTPVTVPNVVGMTQEKAQTTLTAAGLKLGSVENTPTKKAEAGTVVAQTPAAGQTAKSGSAVQLAVAAKPAQVTVPDVVGTSATSADADLRKANLVPAEKSEYSSSVPKGFVVSQKPASGEKVDPGTTVTLTVSKGPQVTNTVTVPDLVGMTQEAAVNKTNTLGLSSKVTSEYDSAVPTGTVSTQSPDAGVSVASGSTVKLTVSLGEKP
jgi:serine/threonine-protein kinase